MKIIASKTTGLRMRLDKIGVAGTKRATDGAAEMTEIVTRPPVLPYHRSHFHRLQRCMPAAQLAISIASREERYEEAEYQTPNSDII